MTTLDKVGFNTQPPEGGWAVWLFLFFKTCRFNTQPPEGGWIMKNSASRRQLSFNTQPPEGGWVKFQIRVFQCFVSTHSRPKAAGLQA